MKKFLCVSIFVFLMALFIVPQSAMAEDPIQIASFDDMKAYLEVKHLPILPENSPRDILVLKSGNYNITKSFTIDLSDPYFVGKEAAVKYGILSVRDHFKLNANGNTITIKKDNAPALFGSIVCDSFEIENLKVNYTKNVEGFAFAQWLQSTDKNEDYAKAYGTVKNLSINVAGDVLPLTVGKTQNVKPFTRQYTGTIATGFCWNTLHNNFDNIDIKIAGNIGANTRPAQKDAMVSAFGFAFGFERVPISATYNPKTYEALMQSNNPEHYKDAGHMIDVSINVGGNIQSFGYDAGYTASLAHYMGASWIERANINIKGDIITDLQGNGAQTQNMLWPYAFGISNEVEHFTDSNLTVNNIIFNSSNLTTRSGYVMIGALADKGFRGYSINVKNNNITVKGDMKAKSNLLIESSIGFCNNWNSNGDRGTDFLQVNENNTYNIGNIDITGEKEVIFYDLAKKCRTGDREGKVLPDVSLKDCKLKAGNLNINANYAEISLFMTNFSNAKNNTLDYENININTKSLNFYGMGHLRNIQPKKNFYNNIAENNHMRVKDITINTDEAQYISLLAGSQEKEQGLKNCTVMLNKLNVKFNKGEKPSIISGIVGSNAEKVESCRLFAGDINIDKSSGSGQVFFGLGTAVGASTISNSSVFVDKDINIKCSKIYGGGFAGYSKNSKLIANDLQVDGNSNVSFKDGSYGGFAGFFVDSELRNNSSLYLNAFEPFIHFSRNSNIDNNAHYVNGKAPQYYAGLIAAGDATSKLNNNTLLVEKKYDDTIVYRKDSLADTSKNNYLVVVDTDNQYNRTAYNIAETNSTSEEMGEVIPVFKKQGNAIGRINIAKRSFQDKYWNSDIAPYAPGESEEKFDYMNANDGQNISVFGIDSNDIVSHDAKYGMLHSYYHRHAGLVSDTGVVYDLLGIKGSVVKDSSTQLGSRKYPATGDNTNIALYMILLILSVSTCYIVFSKKKKLNK